MRVPISFDMPLGRLVDDISLPGAKRRVVKALMESFLWEDSGSFREAVATATAADTKSLLSDVRELLCWSQVESDPNAIRITVGDRSLQEILDSEEISNAVTSLYEPIRRGGSRQSTFDKKFAIALKLARRVEVIDAYAASNMLNPRSGTMWFLSQTLHKFNGVISIYSQVPQDSRYGSPNVEAGLARLLENAQQLVGNMHGFGGVLRITLVDSYLMPHNRRLALRFDSGQATTVLEKGLAIFDADPFAESHEMSNADLVEFKKVIHTLSGSKNQREMVIRHLDHCSACK